MKYFFRFYCTQMRQVAHSISKFEATDAVAWHSMMNPFPTFNRELATQSNPSKKNYDPFSKTKMLLRVF